MHPPSSEKDNRKKSDIAAARYNLENKIPIGILHKVKNGQNRILGLGLIVSERNDGVFIVEPYSYAIIKVEPKIVKEEIMENKFKFQTCEDFIDHINSYITSKGFFYPKE